MRSAKKITEADLSEYYDESTNSTSSQSIVLKKPKKNHGNYFLMKQFL